MTLRSMSFRHTVRLYWRPSGSTSRTDESCSGTGCELFTNHGSPGLLGETRDFDPSHGETQRLAGFRCYVWLVEVRSRCDDRFGSFQGVFGLEYARPDKYAFRASVLLGYAGRVVLDPSQDIAGVLVRGKDRVEDMLDRRFSDHHR